MWEMFDDIIECDDCGGVIGPPPKFTIPPPPRPPYLGEYSLTNCNEEDIAARAQKAWDGDICEAMPILDASLYSGQTVQTSAIIAVFTLLLVLVVLISSLFVWKNKRKVQNFLPCKTPTRGPHLNGALPLGGANELAYEDPDVHLGHHRPLVMRHHHNVEMLHGKAIHYPSGFPMTRSPPFLVSSSPGPDPYRSNDNVYEELGPGRETDGESDPPLQSDDDFAEDELSLPGERLERIVNANLSTIYHERTPTVSNMETNSSNDIAIAPERNSVLSTSSASTQEASTSMIAAISSPNQISNDISCNRATTARTSAGNLLPGILRHSMGRNKFHTANSRTRCRMVDRERNAASIDDFNTSTSTTDTNEIGPMQQIYDTRSNLMSLAYIPQPQPHQKTNNAGAPSFHSLHHLKNINKTNTGHFNDRCASVQFYNTTENEVERRNRMNDQLNNAPPPISTIYRERINCPGERGRPNFRQQYYSSNSNNGLLASSMRARTISKSMERHNRVVAPTNPIEPNYGYAEPIYHDDYHYNRCGSPADVSSRLVQHPITAYASSQLMSGYPMRSAAYQDHSNHNQNQNQNQDQQHLNLASTFHGNSHFYSRGDSSFGSDSGYSHHTPASSIGRHDYDTAQPQPLSIPSARTGSKESATSKISAALGFGWHRRKSTPTPTPNASAVLRTHTASQNNMYINTAEATSPNNNSASSTTTFTLENTSSGSSASASGCSTASNNNNNSVLAAQAET